MKPFFVLSKSWPKRFNDLIGDLDIWLKDDIRGAVGTVKKPPSRFQRQAIYLDPGGGFFSCQCYTPHILVTADHIYFPQASVQPMKGSFGSTSCLFLDKNLPPSLRGEER